MSTTIQSIVPATAAPSGVTANFIDPPTRGPEIIWTVAWTLSLALMFGMIRLYTKIRILNKMGGDDYLLICAMVSAIIFEILGVYGVHLGLGRDLWNVPLSWYKAGLVEFFVIEMFYFVSICFCKLSILCFYIRFAIHKFERYFIFAMLGFVTAYNITTVLALIFACKPISATWDYDVIQQNTATCISQDPIYYMNSISNTLTDMVILIMPIRTLWNLRLPLGQKISLAWVFSAGGFVIVVTVIRMLQLAQIDENNITMSFTGPTVWSIIEVNLCLICASVPALKPFIQRYCSSLFGKWNSGYGGGSAYRSRSRNRGANGIIELVEGDEESGRLRGQKQTSSTRGKRAERHWDKNVSGLVSQASVGKIKDGNDSSDSILEETMPRPLSGGILKGTNVTVRYENVVL